MTDQRNLILAIVLSVGIILAFQVFYEMPRMRDAQERAALQEAQRQTETVTPSRPDGVPGTVAVPGVGVRPADRGTVLQAQAETRARIDNGRLHGSVPLTGLRIDDVTLVDYREAVDPRSPEIALLSPAGSPETYFAEFGWVTADAEITVPGSDTVWETAGRQLTATSPLQLAWDNGQGLRFGREVAVDGDFMFTITQSVTNQTDRPVTLHPYGLISRWGTPPTMGFFILHEGPIGVLDGTLKEITYSKLQDQTPVELDSNGGWIGITDKYWLAALIPDQDTDLGATFRHYLAEGDDRYQVDFLRSAITVEPGQTVSVTDRLFAGAKEVDKLDAYAERYGIPLFDRAVDFGWFYFLTKPIFHMLTFFYGIVGNYGVAILLLTLVVKLLFFPLANKSYRAMSQMKKLQPEMLRLREQYSDDKVRMNQELMALYKREKVNPMAGCLPIIVQIPVFFALYKVLFVSIEMRHAPFFGWIQDLAAPDPTSIFNLFGLLPFAVPAFLTIGVWPILMGLTMWLQTKLNPAPADPIQARVMQLLPVVFVFLFATFPAGLVIYWTWNNILSIAQQWLIMKRMNVPIS
jgi:YidC/Oxa1 family membrane protein insertase